MSNDEAQSLLERIAQHMDFELGWVRDLPKGLSISPTRYGPVLECWFQTTEHLRKPPSSTHKLADNTSRVIHNERISINGVRVHYSFQRLLNNVCSSPYFLIPIEVDYANGIGSFNDHIRAKNPFYSMSIDELKVKLDLLGA